MGLLDDFKTMDFVGRITALNEISEKNALEYLDPLLELFLTPLGDRPVDEMVRHTLTDLLSGNEAETVARLKAPNPRIRRLCLQITGRNHFMSAAPVLVDMVGEETDPHILQDTFQAMALLKVPAFLEVFQKGIHHPDQWISGLCIKMIGEYNDIAMIPGLTGLVEEGETADRYETCALPTAQALEVLARLATPTALRFLVSKIHHKNPTARRIIHEKLVQLGALAVPLLAEVFETGNRDEKILAAAILGEMGLKKAGNVLVEALDNGHAEDPNVRFALYEAFGNIQFMKGLVCLLDALEEKHELILLSVVTALDRQLNPFVAEKLKEFILEPRAGQKDPNIKTIKARGRRILKAVINSRSLDTFAALYQEPPIADTLIEILGECPDEDLVTAHMDKLETMEGTRPAEHLAQLAQRGKTKTTLKALAIDDSSSMLAFYRSVLSNLHMQVLTASNGREALETLEKNGPFHLIVTDMNMPVMDGIEFTRKAREHLAPTPTPIIMVTTESERSQRKLAAVAGVDDFASKPMTTAAFAKKIRQHLPDDTHKTIKTNKNT